MLHLSKTIAHDTFVHSFFEVFMKQIVAIFMLGFALMSNASAQQGGNPPGLVPTPDDAGNVVRKPSYSPYAGRNFPSVPLWKHAVSDLKKSLPLEGA